MAISKQNFDFVSAFVEKQAAIVLEPEKEYLVESRLQPLAREEGFTSLDEYVDAVRAAPLVNGRHSRIVDALTTNETTFFRDHFPFEALRKTLLPEHFRRNATSKTLTLWSAACSTGQEPYSLAMMLRREFPKESEEWTIRIVATDLSKRVLAQAEAGSYTQFEVNRGLPAPYLIRYFAKDGQNWAIKDEIKKMVDFKQLNLMHSWALIPRCDFVFIRNVLIYFDVETKREIFERMKSVLTPNSYMFLGGGETTAHIHTGFEPSHFEGATCFKLKG